MCFYDSVVCSRASNGWTHCCNFTWLIINSAWLKSDAHMHPMHKWQTPIGIILYSDRLAQLALSVRPRIKKNLNSKMRLIELILHEYKRIPIGPAIYHSVYYNGYFRLHCIPLKRDQCLFSGLLPHMAEQGIPSWELIHHQFVSPIFGRVTDES